MMYQIKTERHLDICMTVCLRHILASGSVDFTLGIWDLNAGEMAMQVTQPQEKVQSVIWHPFEAQTLLAGSCDK